MMIYWIGLGLIVISLAYLLYSKKKKTKVFLKGDDQWVKVYLEDVRPISHDSKIFVFGFPDKNMELGLHLGAHVLFRATIPTAENPKGETIVRKYTPTSKYNVKGKIELPIKVYYKNVHPGFPEGGKMTQYLDSLKIGSELEISGPKGRLRYLGRGKFKIENEDPFTVKNLGVIAGGTGITPGFQLIQYIIEEEKGIVNLSLLYANKTEEDILLRDRLEQYQALGKLKLFYTLDSPPRDWKYGTGYISQDMLKNNLPPVQDSFIIYCGPPLMNASVKKSLEALEYTKTFKF
jgi:cytochrome-b5 reductase